MKYIDWLIQWLENYIRPSVKMRTYERYKLIIEQHIKDKIGGLNLNDLSPLVLQSFITELLQSGNKKTGKGLSANSVNAVISVIQSSLKTAHLLGLTKDYTADKLKRPKLKEKPVECFTLAEQKQIEQAVLNGKKDKLYGIILCLYSGLRIGELIALQWSDIDFAKGIGRIRRMPEAKHYDNDTLDSCYLYTFDGKFTQGVKASLGKSALEAKTLFLKSEHKTFSLIKEQRTMVTDLRDPRRALTAIAKHLKSEYGLTGDKKQNRVRLESKGYIFSDSIVRYTLSGNVVALSELSEKDKLNAIAVKEPINTHTHGREYHNRVGKIGLEIGMPYAYMNTILGKLFGEKYSYSEKVLALTTRELYAFVINNTDLLRRIFRDAMAAQLAQMVISDNPVSEKAFTIPQSMLFTYDATSKVQTESTKNVYQGYLLSAEPRSSSEKKFEKLCETCEAVDWIYKNGDKGDEYFSIVYNDNSGAQKLFYPDYVLSVSGETWIIETKGGFTRSGDSEDIDIFSPKKFEVLQSYLKKHGIKGGFVRYDKQSEELCICTENYSDDIHSDSWKILKDVWKQ